MSVVRDIQLWDYFWRDNITCIVSEKNMAIVGMNIMVQINFVLDDFDILLLKEDVWHSNDSSEQNCES